MSETPSSDTTSNAAKSGQNFWIEFGPVLVFVGLYHYLRRGGNEGAIYTAALVFMVCAVMGLAYSRLRHGKFPGMLVLSTVIIAVSVGLAWVFKDPTFIYMKPTIINILFGLAVIGGVLIKKNVIKLMMGAAFDMPDKAWNTLAIRWGVFFFVLAALNEVIWRNYSEAFWVNFKLFGMFPLTIIFTLMQLPFMLKNGQMRQ